MRIRPGRAAGIVLLGAVGMFSACGPAGISPGSAGAGDGAEELAVAVAGARPGWTAYTEELKAALGATPVARWEGRPIRVERDGAVLFVTFELDAPWRSYGFGLPVLLRDPLGGVRLPSGYAPVDEGGRYRYELDGVDAETVLPWVEVKYPRERTQRLVLDGDGGWRAAGH